MSATTLGPRAAPLTVATELALISVTLSVVVGFARIFAGWSFFGPLALAAVSSHLIAVIARRLRLGIVTAQVLSLVGLVVLGAIVFYASTTRYGIPTPRTWHTFSTELSAAWNRFDRVVALVPSAGGELVTAFIAVWIAAQLADAFAFRATAMIESLVPTGLVFVFCSALAADRLRVASAGLLVAALFGYALFFTSMRQHSRGTWLSSDRNGATGALLAGGSVLGLSAVVLGLLAGPALPGAYDHGLLNLQGTGGGATRTIASPLVDIRGRLVDTSTSEVFTVKAARPAYWRLTSLDIFNGTIWYSENSYRSASGTLGTTPPGATKDTQLDQQYTIESLGSIWLPAAFTPAYLTGAKGVAYDEGSSTLVTRASSTDGVAYGVASIVPKLSPATLESAAPLPAAITNRFLELPVDFPAPLRLLAEQITNNAVTPYQKARALQDWFRGNFTYDLSVRFGDSTDAIQAFIAAKRGYCEQFAGSFAALARSLGIPARVAVGYTPGNLGSDGLYHVLGKHAHAWPEVYLAGAGWVAFEPTPGRGAPGNESYTGVPPQQASDSGSIETVPTVATTTSATTTAPKASNRRTEPNNNPLPNLGLLGLGARHRGASPWPGRLELALVTLAIAALLWPLVMEVLLVIRRRRRWWSAPTAELRALALWEDALEAVALAGRRPGRGETRGEFARRGVRDLGAAMAPLEDLARGADAAVFAGGTTDSGTTTSSRAVLADIRRAVRAKVPLRTRILRLADPRTFASPHPRRGLLKTRSAR